MTDFLDTLFRVDPETAVVTEVARFDFTGGERLYALTLLGLHAEFE